MKKKKKPYVRASSIEVVIDLVTEFSSRVELELLSTHITKKPYINCKWDEFQSFPFSDKKTKTKRKTLIPPIQPLGSQGERGTQARSNQVEEATKYGCMQF